jgi:hypothetical protein
VIFKLSKHILVVIILTVFTQIGGVVYALIFIGLRNLDRKIKLLSFVGAYLVVTFWIIPCFSPIFGRVKIANSKHLEPRSFFYSLTNRNYVVPEMNDILKAIAVDFERKNPGVKLVYLDANFPFFDGFPLLPHLSHDDGKKIDLCFLYENVEGNITNRKPSVSGYGIYEEPRINEFNQINICKRRGFWQYDFPKYLTFGHINNDVQFSNKANKELINLFLKYQQVSKIFIEPHLKERLQMNNSKIRFHGCQAVRHDDHIHIQLR